MSPTRKEETACASEADAEAVETLWTWILKTDAGDIDEEVWEEAQAIAESENVAFRLERVGIITVLFETPSGFAIFMYDGNKLYRPNAIESIWRDFTMDCFDPKTIFFQKYATFEDKTNAINHDTGVNKELSMLLEKYVPPWQRLAVGKPEYKKIIEEKMKLYCLCDEAVMELMWGLKNVMPILLPQEKSEPTQEDLQMSKGMKIVLDRHGFDVRPEMVDDRIIQTTRVLHDCDFAVNKHSKDLRSAGKKVLEKISGINTEDWDLLKLATALMLACNSQDEVAAVDLDPMTMFSAEEFSRLTTDVPKYERKLYKVACRLTFGDIVSACQDREKALKQLTSLVKEAQQTTETVHTRAP